MPLVKAFKRQVLGLLSLFLILIMNCQKSSSVVRIVQLLSTQPLLLDDVFYI